MKKLIGNTDIEDSLNQLDKLTQEEARMASAEQLRIAHSIEGKVMSVDEKVQGVGDDVQNVGKRVEDVDDTVQGINDRVKDVGDKVQGVDRKLDDTTCLSSLGPLALHSEISDLFSGNLLRDNHL